MNLFACTKYKTQTYDLSAILNIKKLYFPYKLYELTVLLQTSILRGFVLQDNFNSKVISN